MRALIALGGNAMTDADGSATWQAQTEAIGAAMEAVARVVAAGVDVILTHGNGPQVGNLLVKNELSAHVVPPVPLDWCGAQTQGTVGFLALNSLDRALSARGIVRRPAVVLTRTLVSPDDPAFLAPTKPVGRYLPRAEAAPLIAHGQTWQDRGERGWRRVVASPEPLEILDADPIRALVAAGFVVMAAGGGGVPTVRGTDGTLRGVEAVIDKDLGAALLARTVGADVLIIATDVDAAVLGYAGPAPRPLGRVPAGQLRAHAAAGEFASGSMGPKVEAALRFVEAGGRFAVITSLERIADAVAGRTGTIVVPNDPLTD